MPSTDPAEPDADIKLRVHAYYPKVAEFARREGGESRDAASLAGPARIEARQQDARERIVAGAELKVLQEKLRWCYHKEGVNHYENCKGIAEAYLEKLRAHPSWLLKVRRARGARRRAAAAARALVLHARAARSCWACRLLHFGCHRAARAPRRGPASSNLSHTRALSHLAPLAAQGVAKKADE